MSISYVYGKQQGPLVLSWPQAQNWMDSPMVRKWGKGNPRALWEGMEMGAAIMETSMEAPKKN